MTRKVTPPQSVNPREMCEGITSSHKGYTGYNNACRLCDLDSVVVVAHKPSILVQNDPNGSSMPVKIN